MAQSTDQEQLQFLDEKWAAAKENDKTSPEEDIEERLINWVEGWSSEHKYKFIWWDGEGGEVLKVVFQEPDTLHIASLYPRKLAKEVGKGERKLYANNVILWALIKLRGDTKAIKRILYYCIVDENLKSLELLIEAEGRTDQTAKVPDLRNKGIIAAAIRAFGEPSKLFLGGARLQGVGRVGAQIVIEFPGHK